MVKTAAAIVHEDIKSILHTYPKVDEFLQDDENDISESRPKQKQNPVLSLTQ